jgi:hypothetical protein
MKKLFAIIFSILALQSLAQEIGGKVLNEKKEPVVSAVIQVFQGGIMKGGDVTDIDGNYVIKPLDPGSYAVLFIYPGYDSVLINGAVVSPNARTTQNCQLALSSGVPKKLIQGYRKPLIEDDKVIKSTCGEKTPNIEITDLVSFGPVCFGPNGRSGDHPINSHPSGGTVYVIDGNPVYMSKLPMINSFGGSLPVADADNPTSFILTRQEISLLPTTDVSDMLILFPGVYQSQRGGDVNIYGARSSGNLYVWDGVRLMR